MVFLACLGIREKSFEERFQNVFQMIHPSTVEFPLLKLAETAVGERGSAFLKLLLLGFMQGTEVINGLPAAKNVWDGEG